MAKDQKNKHQEKTDRELLEEINRKIDLLLDWSGLAGNRRKTAREIESMVKDDVQKWRDRQAQKKNTKQNSVDKSY